MVTRIWHGKTHASKFKEYSEFLKSVAKPDYQAIHGNIGLTFLRRIDGDEAHFTLITYWDSIESIKRFAGTDVDKAKYYPEDSTFLLEFEEKVTHFEVFAQD